MGNPAITELEYCTYCPKMCRHACPVSTATGVETYTPQAKMQLLFHLRRGDEPWSRPGSDPLWACTGCRHCTLYCVHENEPGRTLMAGRAEAVRRGVGHAALDRYPERFRARDERLSRTAREVLSRERFAEEAQVGYWPGCDTLDKNPADARAHLRLFDRVGAEHVRIVDAGRSCAGYPLLAAGYPDVFRWHATRVAAELSRYRTVVMNCSACVYTIRALYPAEGVHTSFEVLHVAEYLEPFLERLPKREAGAEPVYYHDPCYLSRYQNVTHAPRKLLGRVAEVREFGWSHGDTECCGGGGLLPKTMPAAADAMARRRLRQVAASGPVTVATSCGTCRHMLARNAPPGVTVRDALELVEARWRIAAGS